MRQVVPPWGRLFTGPLRFRVVEDNGTYDYEKEISEADHSFTFKLHSKVRKCVYMRAFGRGSSVDQSVHCLKFLFCFWWPY